MSIRELKKFVDLPIPVYYHLVLSNIEQHQILDSTIAQYSDLPIQSLVTTKTDIQDISGEMYSLHYKWDIPFSILSCGQNIPSDIAPAEKDKILESIFDF